MFYGSGNRDEAAFDEPDPSTSPATPTTTWASAAVERTICLGASFARTQLRAIFGELLTRAPSLEVGAPVPMVSSVINGVKRMPFSL